jgi:hypothetical protein
MSKSLSITEIKKTPENYNYGKSLNFGCYFYKLESLCCFLFVQNSQCKKVKGYIQVYLHQYALCENGSIPRSNEIYWPGLV